MGKNTSIALGDYFESFVTSTVQRKDILIKALKEGEESGYVEDFDPDILLKELHAKHNQK